MTAERRNDGFELSLKRLEEIVNALEQGNVTLGDSMAMFEEGTRLIQGCCRQLDDAEQKVVRLRKGRDGAPEEEPFSIESRPGADRDGR